MFTKLSLGLESFIGETYFFLFYYGICLLIWYMTQLEGTQGVSETSECKFKSSI